jgi:hypothetical protein
MKIVNERNFWSGVMFVGFGLFFSLFGRRYELGTAERMGPAFFPTALGLLLMLLGVIISLAALSPRAGEERIEAIRIDALAWIVGSIVAFALLLRPAGLVVAMSAMILIGGRGSHDFRWRDLLLLTIGLVSLVLVVFIWGLNLTIPTWPAFIK